MEQRRSWGIFTYLLSISSFGLVLNTQHVRPGFSQFEFCFLHRTRLIFPKFYPMWDSAFRSAAPPSLWGFSCPSLAAFNVAPTAAHHSGTFPNEKWGWNESILPSFHHFSLLGVSLWSAVWQSYHLPVQHIIPAGSLQTCDQKEGLKILNSSHLANALRCPKRATAWDGGGKKMHGVWQRKKRHYYSGLSPLMVCFLENMQLNKNGVSRAIGGRMTFVWGLKHFPCCCFSQEAYIIDIAGLVTNKHLYTGLCK